MCAFVWSGDRLFMLENLVFKDFRIRYRNMSLGVFWSIINPLVMMGVLTFVFSIILPSKIPNFAVFLLCGLIPFNFFATSWLSGTLSVVDNFNLVKRVAVPRELVPISSVVANVPHLLIQMVLLFVIAIPFGITPNVHWVWLPALWIMEVVFVSGLALVCSALNVFVRDIRYVVESATLVLWWLVPILYPFSFIPPQFAPIYEYNPVAAIVLAMRNIILDQQAPSGVLMSKLALVSVVTAAAGWLIFKRLEDRFYSYI